MVDLVGQHQKIRSELDQAIASIIDTASFIKGAPVSNFEHSLAQYLSVEHVVGCANGTDALQAAIMALDLPKGAEILVPDFTFISTAEVIALLGYKPVFVDVERQSFNMSVEAAKKAITPQTKAIIPVHMFGLPCDMEAIMSLAEAHQLWVIEDTAQAMGASFTFKDGSVKKVGTIGHIGCTSFFPSKNLSCMGDGGAIFTSNELLGKKLATICNHGMNAQYHYELVGMNSRLDALQAAVLNVKLHHLDAYNEARRTSAEKYSEGLAAVAQVQCPWFGTEQQHHIFHQYTLTIPDDSRDALQSHLQLAGIPSKIYYPVPFHAHKPYATFIGKDEHWPNSDWLCEHVLSLPMHTELDDETIAYITNSIKEFYK